MPKYYSTGEVCRIVGISQVTIYAYIRKKKICPPPIRKVCGVRVRPWTDDDVARVRAVLQKRKHNADVSQTAEAAG